MTQTCAWTDGQLSTRKRTDGNVRQTHEDCNSAQHDLPLRSLRKPLEKPGGRFADAVWRAIERGTRTVRRGFVPDLHHGWLSSKESVDKDEGTVESVEFLYVQRSQYIFYK